VFRHSYNYNLDPERVSSLQQKLLAGWDRIEPDPLRFEQFLWGQLQSE